MELHKKNINFIQELLETNRILDGKNFSVTYFNSGGGTHLYLIEAEGTKYLARINFYEPKNEWGIREQEYKVLKLLEPLSIAPKVYYLSIKNELGQQLTIVDYIEGQPLDTISDSHVISLSDTLKKLHTNTPFDKSGDTLPPTDDLPYECGIFDEFGNGEDKRIEKYELAGIDEVTPHYNRIKNNLGEWFNGLEIFEDCTKFCLCHADLKSENILDQNGRAVLIDWECAGSDIPETDIGRLFSGCQFTKEQETLFLKHYYNGNVEEISLQRIHAVKTVLDFFRIIEDFILLRRKEWNPNEMILELQKFEKNLG
ncbi:MAG: phosphotransferase [Patescibacteria group bacterium]